MIALSKAPIEPPSRPPLPPLGAVPPGLPTRDELRPPFCGDVELRERAL